MAGYDVGIAGCGIAGLAAALLLHRRSHRVTLYERFAEPRPLGSGLMIQPTGLAVLSELGLAGEAIRHGAQVERLFGRNPSGRVVLDARYSDLRIPRVFGLGIHRASLFGALFDAVTSEGIAVRTRCEIAGSGLSGPGRRLMFADGEASPVHDLVVDALGLHSTLIPPTDSWLPFGAMWANLEWPPDGPFDETRLEQRYRDARQMVGVIPIGRRSPHARRELAFFWSLRADQLGDWTRAGLGAWKDEVRRLWPECESILEQIAEPDQLTFARYSHRTLRRPCADRIVHLGDAWHSASPQLGQGANMALLDAWALAHCLGGPGPLSEKLDRMVKSREAHVRLYQWLTAIFTPLYQSDSTVPALLRDWLLAPLSRVGPAGRIQAMLVSGLVGAPLKPLALKMPDYAELRAVGG